jgi:hypothetical protein
MGVWRAEYFQVRQILYHYIHGVTGLSGDNGRTKRISETCPARPAGNVLFGRLFAVKSVRNTAIAGAPAQISFQGFGKIRQSLIIESRGGHNHPRRAKTALERLGLEERLLNGMQIAIAGETFDGGHLMIRRAKGWHQTAMHRFSIEPNRTGAAVTAIATFLDTEPTEFANEGSQALAWPRFSLEAFSINLVAHKYAQAARLLRICSAK